MKSSIRDGWLWVAVLLSAASANVRSVEAQEPWSSWTAASPFPTQPLANVWPCAAGNLGGQCGEPSSALPVPQLTLSREFTLRTWEAVAGPLAVVAAAFTFTWAAHSQLVVLATSSDAHEPGMRLTLECFPPRCGALVLARF